MHRLDLNLIWNITRKGVWLGLKSGVIAGGTFIGLLSVIGGSLLLSTPAFSQEPFWSFVIKVYLLAIAITTATGLVLGLLLGFYTAILTFIFLTYLPASPKYCVVIIWAAFFSCFTWTYVLSGKINGLQNGWPTIGLLLACYGSWIVTRLVSWIEDSHLKQPAPKAEIKSDYRLVYRISKLKEKDWSRYQIDRELLKAGYSPEELERAWLVTNLPRPAKPGPDLKGWGRVIVGVAALVALIALVFWVL